MDNDQTNQHDDKEISAIGQIFTVLEPLTPRECARVIAYVADKYIGAQLFTPLLNHFNSVLDKLERDKTRPV